MSDPRNVAHDKKVKQANAHENPESGARARSKKSGAKKSAGAGDQNNAPSARQLRPKSLKAEQGSAELEKSVAVLSKLKEMEFHSRATIEPLAGLSLTIEDELKQKEFSEAIGDVYSAQDGFQTKITALIERYDAKCESLKQPALRQ